MRVIVRTIVSALTTAFVTAFATSSIPLVMVITATATAPRLYAQSAIPSVAVPMMDSAAIAAARAKADTGRMVRGYQDLTRYTSPGYCFAAVYGMTQRIWRRGESDTLPIGLPSDTIPTAARAIGKQCVSKMTPQSVDRIELYDLTRVALEIGDTALARHTIEYQLSLATNDRERGIIYYEASMLARDARPVPLAFLESLVTAAATLGPEAGYFITRIYTFARSSAIRRFDTTAMLRLSAQREEWARGLTPEQRREAGTFLGAVYQDSVEIVHFKEVPNLPETVGRLGTLLIRQAGMTGRQKLLWEANVDSWVRYAKLLGGPAPTLKMSLRFPADAPLAPVAGRVTVIATILYSSFERGKQVNVMENVRMPAYLARLRRMYERYHDQGLDIVLVGKTRGNVWGSPPLSAADEARVLAWYIRDYLGLPFPVLVEETHFGHLRDGRRVPVAGEYSKLFGAVGTNFGYLVGRDGTLAAINGVFLNEAALEAYIRRELARPSSTPAAVSAPAPATAPKTASGTSVR